MDTCLSTISIPVTAGLEGSSTTCKGCFVSHFPRPNQMLCKWDKSKKRESKPTKFKTLPHLKGGARDSAQAETEIITRAIANAYSHGINVHSGVKNLANGNCAFESIIDSINTRPDFEEVLDGNPDYWRKIWMSEVETLGFENWNGGLSKKEWEEGWNLLKKPGVYEHDLGDLVLPGIAHCTQKDILIFNTSMDAHRPIFVVEASMLFGKAANTQVPILLAYNQSHYEMLVPDNPEDIQRTIDLKYEFVSGNYDRKMEDVPFCTLTKPSKKNMSRNSLLCSELKTIKHFFLFYH